MAAVAILNLLLLPLLVTSWLHGLFPVMVGYTPAKSH